MENKPPDQKEPPHWPQRLKDQGQHFRLIVSSVKDYAIFMLDPGGHIISWNAGAEKIKGYKEHEILGKHFSTFYPEVDVANGKPARELEQAIEQGRVEDEGWRVRIDGTRFWANVIITPVYDEDHILLGFSKVTRDLTERKLAQEKLQETQEQLLQSNRMGGMIQIAAIVAKEFESLTKAIIRQTKILAGSLDKDSPLRPRVEEIGKIAENASSLTDQLSAFSSTLVLNPKLLDLNVMVTSIRGTLQWLLGKNVKLETKLSSSIGWVSIDPFQMENVIINLAGRAREIVGQDGVFAIETSSVAVNTSIPHINGVIPAGKYVKISVSDTGPGLEKEIQARIFEPFFRTAENRKDTGLRLSMVYGIIRQSGGHLLVKSELQRGTQFEIYLPEAADSLPRQSDH